MTESKPLTREEILAKVRAGESLTGAVLRRADLTGAVLTGAVLTGAVLRRAVLTDADLTRAVLTGARLPSGETWEEYLSQVVPALCTAGGVPLGEVAKHFDCHTWENCPMAAAFGVHRLEEVPRRPRAGQFIRFFDMHLIEAIVAEDGSVTFSSPVAVKVATP